MINKMLIMIKESGLIIIMIGKEGEGDNDDKD